MRLPRPETGEDDKVSPQIDLGMLQEVLPLSLMEELLETYQMGEEREHQTNMGVIDETGTHLPLAARPWCRLTPEGVLQQLSAHLVAHLAIRTLLLLAAEPAQLAPTQISFDLHHPHHG
jgi:hypothetical protein